MDDVSNDMIYPELYQFNPRAEWGPSDFDATHAFKLWGSWSPQFFRSAHNEWESKALGGWTFSGIWNVHSGFPWTPVYNVQVANSTGNSCSLIYPGSGYCTVLPAAYLGGAGTDHSNATLESGPTPSNLLALNDNFSKGAASYFVPPTLSASGIPPTPGIERNSFRGPHYSSVDFTIAKAFGLPKMPVLGENGQVEFRTNFYNIFNQVNLTPFPNQSIGTIQLDSVGVQTNPTAANFLQNPTFGQAQNGLAGRVIEMQARFSF
jgi:hypothetical protein